MLYTANVYVAIEEWAICSDWSGIEGLVPQFRLPVKFTHTHLWWSMTVCILSLLSAHSMLQQDLLTLPLMIMKFMALMECWHSKVKDYLCDSVCMCVHVCMHAFTCVHAVASPDLTIVAG